jgi:hypothetical protein
VLHSELREKVMSRKVHSLPADELLLAGVNGSGWLTLSP